VAVVGGSVDNPVNGEHIVWVQTAESSSGQVLAFDLYLKRGAAVAARHSHRHQEERFVVNAGAVGVEIGASQCVVGPGEDAVVPAGVVHRWWNAGEEEAIVRVELRPALDTELFFETLFGLARDGKTNAQGVPGLLQIAVTVHELGDSCSRLARPPVVVQRLVAALVAPVGMLFGRRATYEAYSGGGGKMSDR
jgi:mannose-6-phosphate isomerase-like protein (cupin superfamily)